MKAATLSLGNERVRIYQVLEVLALIRPDAEGTDHACALQLAHDTLTDINDRLGRIESRIPEELEDGAS